MSCCNHTVNIGCFDYCEDIATGYTATQDGVHQVLVYVVNGTLKAIDLDLLIGDEFILPGSWLNETKDHEIKIKQPDGQFYEFEPAVFCIRLTTQVVMA